MRLSNRLFRICRVVVCLVFVFCATGVSQGQEFPTRPITIYCGFEPGATVDVTTRALANEAQKDLKVPIVVENHAGGSGAQMATVPLMVNVAFDPLKDFTFLSSFVVNVGGICVKSDSPFKTFQDLIDYARKNPGMATYSSPGVGGTSHLAIEQLGRQAKVKFKHVPYKGGAPACTALLGGHVVFTGGAGVHKNYVKQGSFRMLAVIVSADRDPDFPEVPTVKELGYPDVPPADHVVYAPAGLPDSIAAKLEPVFLKAAQSPEFKKVAKNIGMPVVIKNRAQITAEFPVLFNFYANLIKEEGLEKKK
jgi:tripartite-type tricarboxylate transporter receptor subunit TctC